MSRKTIYTNPAEAEIANSRYTIHLLPMERIIAARAIQLVLSKRTIYAWDMRKLLKLGVLSDIHNDCEGLRKALEILQDCDKIIHLGDLVEDSPAGNDIVDLLIAEKVEGVIGYHDELALNISRNFNHQTKGYIANLPQKIVRGDFHLVHDNPLSKEKNEGLVNSGGYIRDELAAGKVFEEASFKILLVGHTHKAEQYEFNGGVVQKLKADVVLLDPEKRYILNPGPVCEQLRGTAPSVGVFDFANNQFAIRRIW